MEKQIEQTLDSREVAEMVEKNHKDLMRDIKRYIKQMSEANTNCEAERNLAPGDFFREDIYKDANNQERPCYKITKKGCEFIAHKLTGTKGTAFTARYINRFHEMEGIITADHTAVQVQGSSELEELRVAVQAQGKILDSISRRLAGSAVIRIGSRNEQDRYKVEIVRMVESMQDRDALCKVYTFTKYVPQMAEKS